MTTFVFDDKFDQVERLENQKITIPKPVANWIEKCKANNFNLQYAMDSSHCPKNIFVYLLSYPESFAKAWLYGYEIEKEKRYSVFLSVTGQPLEERDHSGLVFVNDNSIGKSKFTKQELINAGFGGVFDNDMFDVEEVDD